MQPLHLVSMVPIPIKCKSSVQDCVRVASPMRGIDGYADVVIHTANTVGGDEQDRKERNGGANTVESAMNRERVFKDNDFNGIVDSLQSQDCTVKSIAIEADKDDSEKPNYCYRKEYSGKLGIAVTVASFGADAFSKALLGGGPLGWLGATAIDCGAMYLDYKLNKVNWPGPE